MASLDVIWGGRFVFDRLGYRDVEFDASRSPRQGVRRFEIVPGGSQAALFRGKA